MKRNKKLILIALMLTIIVAITLAACDKGGGGGQDPSAPTEPSTPPTPSHNPVVEVVAKVDEVTVTDSFEGYRFDRLFTVTEDGANVYIQDKYIDLSELPTTPGEGKVTCTYKNKSASVKVILRSTVYKVTARIDALTVNQVQVDNGIDFSNYFSVTADDKPVEITDDMIESNVSREIGKYRVTVRYRGAVASIEVSVTEGHLVEVINSYNEFEISEDKLASFDATILFSLYFDGEAVKVTNDMIDASALEGATAGNTYTVTLSYENNGFGKTATARVKVVESARVVVTGKNVETYPNGTPVDVTSLFSITKGDEIIPVTPEMITGVVDYTKEGENVITLTYGGVTKTSIVSVRYGVIVNLPHGDNIVVKVGEDKNSYDFASDFSVIVNGVKYTLIDDLIDVSEVDFSKAGTTNAKITVKYNKDSFGISGPKYETYEKTVTYVVVENTYEITIKNENVVLEKGTTEYDVLSNLKVKVNGKNLMPYPDKEVVKTDPLAVWTVCVSDIDFNSIAQQKVTLKVYVDGVDAEPVEVSYYVVVKSDIVVNATDKVVFSHTTVFTKDLFEITKNGESLPVTNDFIEGKIDTFEIGKYTATINYLGFVATATVYVLDEGLVGNYKTVVTPIPEKEDGDDEDYGGGWGDEDYGWGTASYASASAVSYGFSVSKNGDVVLNGTKARMAACYEDGSIVLEVGNNSFTLKYADGIAMLNPDNSLKMKFSDYKRPFVFFKDSTWRITAQFAVNTLSQYVLAGETVGTSYDVYKIVPTAQSSGYKTKFFTMKTRLTEKSNADTSYNVLFGDCAINGGSIVVPSTGSNSTLYFDGETINFTMLDSRTGKTFIVSETPEYANKKFTGTIDGETAEIRFDRNEAMSLIVKYKTVASFNKYDVAALKNGYIDHDNKEIFVYKFDAENYYSYKISLDVENGTFTLLEKDNLYGIYKNGNKYVYLDGYGTGHVNFGQASQYDTSVSYVKNGGEVDLTFLNTKPSFEYGNGATMYIDSFGNVLYAKDFVGGIENGSAFENERVAGGAVVKIAYNVIGADATGNKAKQEFYNSLSLVTKDGTVSGEDAIKNICGKGKTIDTTTISFTKGGFYKYTITADVFGEKVTKTFSVQVLPYAYADNEYACSYGGGLINKAVTLSVDANGRVNFFAGSDYTGVARFNDEGFFAKVTGENGDVHISATTVSAGLILAKFSGAVKMNDYFVIGGSTNSFATGANGRILRKIVYNGTTTWYFSNNTALIGEIATINLINGSDISVGAIIEIVVGEEKTIAKIRDTSNVTNGLQFADALRGEYVSDTEDKLVLDGFGNASLGTQKGQYQINADNSVSVRFADGLKVYVVENGRYTAADVVLDESLVEGKTYSADFSFSCENAIYRYTATTTLSFGRNGVVFVRSTCPEHDGGEYACDEDSYSAVYAGANGASGTYSVNDDKITVTVGAYTFTFTIKDVSTASELVCTSTNVSSDSPGYFAAGTTFIN